MSFCKLEPSDNGFFVLTMDSMDGHNYLTEKAITDLLANLENVRKDDKVKGLVTTCQGRVFSDGLDYDNSSEEQAEGVAKVIRLLLELPVPTVAAVRGNATSLGLALALAHDHCFVWEHAVLGLPEAQLGRPLPDFVAALLRDKISYARLRKLLMLKSQTCTGKELHRTWWSTHGSDGDRQVVLKEAVDLLYDVEVGDGASFAKTRQMLCAETCAAVGISIQKRIPRPSRAQLASDEAAMEISTIASEESDEELDSFDDLNTVS